MSKRWKDEYLMWDPDKFGGVSTIRLSSKKIWIPDVMLYNTADTQHLEREVLVVIYNTGQVLWIPHRVYHSSCSVDVRNFPFDSQQCHMTFGSWAYHGNELDLVFFENLDKLDISDLERENTQWEILSKSERRKIEFYDCCTEPYVTLTFTLNLKRKIVFSSFMLTLPCIFLACMTLVVFWLPPERPDRTSLAMSLFASFLVLLLILVEAAPPTASSVPTLGIYYCFNMVVIMLSIFLSSLVINVSRRGDTRQPLPDWLTCLSVQGIGRLFIRVPPYYRKPRSFVHVEKPGRADVEQASAAVIINAEAVEEGTTVQQNNLANHLRCTPNGEIDGAVYSSGFIPDVTLVQDPETGGVEKVCFKSLRSQFLPMQKSLKTIERILQELIVNLKDRHENEELKRSILEWRSVAVTLDRIFFVIFLAAIVASLVTLFPTPF